MGLKALNIGARRSLKPLLLAFLGSIILVTTLCIVAFWKGNHLPASSASVVLESTFSDAFLSSADIPINTNCSDTRTTHENVQRVASRKDYMHMFEYHEMHPCCQIENGEISTKDIVFVVATSPGSESNARAVLGSWGNGLENIVLVGEKADAKIGHYHSRVRHTHPRAAVKSPHTQTTHSFAWVRDICTFEHTLVVCFMGTQCILPCFRDVNFRRIAAFVEP